MHGGFNTPAELADHLRQMVDDEAWIARTVAIQFPTMRLHARDELRKRYEAIRKHEQTRKIQPSDSGLAEGRAQRADIEMGSQALLSALWREHPRILRHLGANG